MLQSEATRTVSVPEVLEASPGDTIEVPVYVDDATGVVGYFLELTYDGTVLELADAPEAGLEIRAATCPERTRGGEAERDAQEVAHRITPPEAASTEAATFWSNTIAVHNDRRSRWRKTSVAKETCK